jgi:hypothetical protein
MNILLIQHTAFTVIGQKELSHFTGYWYVTENRRRNET